MKKIKIKCVFVFLIVWLINYSSFAQVNFIFNSSMNGKDMKGLSTIKILNITTEVLNGRLEAEVRKMGEVSAIVKLIIPSLNIVTGNNLIPFAKFRAAIISYSGNTEGNFVRQTNNLPEGELEYCFRFIVNVKNSPDEIYENCFPGFNMISTPLELILPDDKDQFCNKRPNFSWHPSLPLRSEESYALKLVEKLPGQSSSEAVLVNTPIIFQMNIRSFSMPYPSGSPELKEAKSYAWQVTAINKGMQSISEVWEFTVKCDLNKKDSSLNSFRELKAIDDGGYLNAGAELRFAVYNYYIEAPLDYSLTDLSVPDRKLKGLPSVTLLKGVNNILIDLKKVAGMQEGNEYLLKVVMPDGKPVSLRFKYSEGE